MWLHGYGTGHHNGYEYFGSAYRLSFDGVRRRDPLLLNPGWLSRCDVYVGCYRRNSSRSLWQREQHLRPMGIWKSPGNDQSFNYRLRQRLSGSDDGEHPHRPDNDDHSRSDSGLLREQLGALASRLAGNMLQLV